MRFHRKVGADASLLRKFIVRFNLTFTWEVVVVVIRFDPQLVLGLGHLRP